jgi:hypothetical protein
MDASRFAKEWMENRDVFIKETISETAYFRYEGKWENGVEFSIMQPKDMERIVGVLASCSISFQNSKREAIDLHEREEFIMDLKETMLLHPIFAFFEPNDNPDFVLFVKEISFDELTEGRLARATDEVTRMVMWLSLKFSRRFGVLKER